MSKRDGSTMGAYLSVGAKTRRVLKNRVYGRIESLFAYRGEST